MVTKIAAELKSRLQANPDAKVNLIVRVADSPESHINDVTVRGLTVRHTYNLIAAMAVQGKASDCLTLANQAWVIAIEEDKPVHIM